MILTGPLRETSLELTDLSSINKVSLVYISSSSNSQGGRGNFTYLLEGQIHFTLKLFVGRPIKQF